MEKFPVLDNFFFFRVSKVFRFGKRDSGAKLQIFSQTDNNNDKKCKKKFHLCGWKFSSVTIGTKDSAFFSPQKKENIYIKYIYNKYTIIIHNNYTSTLPEARKKQLSNCPNCHKRSAPAKRRATFTLIIRLLIKKLVVHKKNRLADTTSQPFR